jgi:hypothetical protein
MRAGGFDSQKKENPKYRDNSAFDAVPSHNIYQASHIVITALKILPPRYPLFTTHILHAVCRVGAGVKCILFAFRLNTVNNDLSLIK